MGDLKKLKKKSENDPKRAGKRVWRKVFEMIQKELKKRTKTALFFFKKKKKGTNVRMEKLMKG